MKTREKLIEVARQLFVHKGLENTTMNDIANASEKGRRTIYTYFKNKKEIYNAVLENESDKMVLALKEIADSDSAPDDKLRRFLDLRLIQGVSIGSAYSSIKALFKFDLRRMERIRRLVHDKESALLNGIIDEGVSAGMFDPQRSRLLSSFIIHCIQGMDFAEIDSDSPKETPSVLSDFVEFVVSDITIKKDNQPHKSY